MGEQRHEYFCMGMHLQSYCACVCERYSHLAALAETSQQQSGVGGNNAVLHMLACMLQSYSKHRGEREKIYYYGSIYFF